MKNSEVRAMLEEVAPEAVLLDNPDFDNSIVGISTDGAIIYDLDKMAEELATEDNISLEEAYEFIDYNTLRAIGYSASLGKPPIVMDRSLFDGN